MDSTPTINPVLSQTANEWFQADSEFIGQRIAPIFSSGEQAGEYYVHEIEDALGAADNLERAPGTPYKELTMRLADDSFSTRDRGIVVPVDDRMRAKYRVAWDADAAAVQKGLRNVRLDHEKRVAAAITDASFTLTAAAAAAWDATEAVGKTILTDVDTGIEAVRKASGVKPNLWVIPNDEWLAAIKHNVHFLDRIKSTGLGTLAEVTQAALSDLMGIEIVVPMSLQATSVDGQTITTDDIWLQTESYLVHAAAPGANLDAPSAMRTFMWDGGSGVGDIVVEEYRDDDIRSDKFRVRAEDDIKITSTSLNYIITGI